MTTAPVKPTGKLVEHTFGSDVCFHEHLEDGKVKCLACAHECVISKGGTGICAIRKVLPLSAFLLLFFSQPKI